MLGLLDNDFGKATMPCSSLFVDAIWCCVFVSLKLSMAWMSKKPLGAAAHLSTDDDLPQNASNVTFE